MRIHKLLLTAGIAGALLLGACSKATADNYAKVQAGMTRDEVHGILGKPDETTGGGIGDLTMTAETWKNGKQSIRVNYVGDKVAMKGMSDAKE